MPDRREAFEVRYRPVYGGDEALRENLRVRPRPALRVNRLRCDDPASLLKGLRARGLAGEPVPWWPHAAYRDPDEVIGNLPEHVLGRVYGMDAASLLPALALDPEPGERVLDVAAAPGSKTGMLAELMDDAGLLVANEPDTSRLDDLAWNVQRLGLTSTVATAENGATYPAPDTGFDRVLADVPCSNLGKATPNWIPPSWGVDQIEGLAGLQRGIAGRAVEVLRPGGVLVYSTCTTEPLENEGVVDWLLDRYPVEVEPLPVDVAGSEPVTVFDGRRFDASVEDTLRLHPADHGTEGFYVARLRKQGGEA